MYDLNLNTMSLFGRRESKQTALFSFNTQKKMILESIFFKSTIACTLIKLFFNRYNLNRLSNQKSYFFCYFFHILFSLASAFSCKSYYDFHSLLAFPVEKKFPYFIDQLFNYKPPRVKKQKKISRRRRGGHYDAARSEFW